MLQQAKFGSRMALHIDDYLLRLKWFAGPYQFFSRARTSRLLSACRVIPSSVAAIP